MPAHHHRTNRCIRVNWMTIPPVCATLLCANVLLAGSFAQDFQKAVALREKGENEEAERAFLELAERRIKQKPVRQRCKDEAHGGAVQCAIRRKHYDRAMELAAKIQNGPMCKFFQMEALRAQRKWNEILQLLRNEDLASWPDRLIHRAALLRGRAHGYNSNPEAAERDFLLARKSTMDINKSAFVLVLLGTLYRDALQDDEKALACFAEVVGMPAKPRAKNAGVTGYARSMAKRGEGAKAIAALEQCQAEDAHWRCRLHRCYGDVHAILGDSDRALKFYRKAIAVPDAPEGLVKEIQTVIDKMEHPAQP